MDWLSKKNISPYLPSRCALVRTGAQRASLAHQERGNNSDFAVSRAARRCAAKARRKVIESIETDHVTATQNASFQQRSAPVRWGRITARLVCSTFSPARVAEGPSPGPIKRYRARVRPR